MSNLTAVPTEAHTLDRRYSFMKRFLVSIVILASVLGAYVLIWPWYEFRLNPTESLPENLFLIDKTANIHRGDITAFIPPDNAYYILPRFMKFAAGVPGDVIKVVGRDFYINDMFLGKAKEHSLKGEPLKPSFTEGTYIIPQGHYFFWTPHQDSYDSRYEEIGLITEDRIIGRAIALY